MTLTATRQLLEQRLAGDDLAAALAAVELAEAYADLDDFLMAARHPWTQAEMVAKQERIASLRERLGLTYEAVAA